jgi:hypothetical protein
MGRVIGSDGWVSGSRAAAKSGERLLAEFGGTVAQAGRPGEFNITALLATQSVYYTAVVLEAGQVVTGHHIHVRTAAASLTLASCALFNSALTQVAITADFSATINTVANSSFYIPYTGTYTVTATGVFVMAQLYVGTTPPTILKCTTNAGIADVGFKSGGTRQFGIQTGQATMPTTGAISAANEMMYQGLY